MKNYNLSQVSLKPVYDSLSDDLINEFYNPVLTRTNQYLRVSAYFSAKALSMYSVGLSELYKNRGNYKLIINQEVSEQDYNEMLIGFSMKDSIKEKLLLSLEDNLQLKDELNLSNLAFYIACGLIEIKIAFTSKGIFHDKFGFFIDEVGNQIYFRGSNNETSMAIDSNYEAFDISCNWNATSFEKEKISLNYQKFQDIWENKNPNLLVLQLDDVIKNKLLKFNKEKIINNELSLLENSIYLTLNTEEELIGYIHLEESDLLFNSIEFVFYIKPKTKLISKKLIIFDENLSYRDYIQIIDNFKSIDNIKTIIDLKINEFIKNKNFEIDNRSLIGINIKNRNAKIHPHYLEYKSIVDSKLKRELREKQMWDSFFMFSMKRSSNFSVPGSGKTSSVLGVFSYLNTTSNFKRLIVVGPKSAYNSWINEFELCFGKDSCIPYNWSLQTSMSVSKKYEYLLTETGNTNLIFFNYESLPNHVHKVKDVINSKTLLVFDEIHKIKKYQGINAQASLEFSKKAEYLITLTGTPIPNNYLDIFNNLKILFREDYNSYFGFLPGQLKQPNISQVLDINNKIYPFFCRTSKEQLNVPAANKDIIRKISASPGENLLFENLIKTYKDNKFALLIRILQLESDPSMIFEKIIKEDIEGMFEDIEEFPQISIEHLDNRVLNSIAEKVIVSSKMQSTIELVKVLASEKKQVIIWCIFKKSILNLFKLIGESGIRVDYIYGDIDEQSRNRKLEKFKSSEFQVLITNPHTLAESVSLHETCHDAIYFEYSYNLVHLLQSKDRIHRLGLSQNQYTQYYYNQVNFHVNGKDESLDYRIYSRLSEKEMTMLNAIDNNVLESTTTSQEDLEYIFSTILS